MRALWLVVVVCALGLSSAYADDKVKAIALFDEGIKEMKAGHFDKACKAFEASNRLMSDSGTRGSLARCYTQLGRFASAWTLWRELADTAPTQDLRADALLQAKRLEPRLPRFSVRVAEPVPGLTVTVEGKPVDTTIDVAVPIDPGTYVVEATAPGKLPWKGSVTAAETKTAVIEVPALAAAQVDPGAGVGAGSGPGPGPGGPIVIDDPHRGRGRRALGLVITGLGVVGLAAGGGFGVLAQSRNAKAKDLCGGDIDRCDPARTNEAQAKVDDARSAAKLSTIGFIAGGVAVATGVILYVTAPKSERRSVAVSPLLDAHSAGFVVSGRY